MFAMPKKGIIKCKECNAEFQGEFPDNKNIGQRYYSLHEELSSDLVKLLEKHHLDSHKAGIMGHEDFDVFLEDGSLGTIEAGSYGVIYRELGKERER